jgi:hypothetical protein
MPPTQVASASIVSPLRAAGPPPAFGERWAKALRRRSRAVVSELDLAGASRRASGSATSHGGDAAAHAPATTSSVDKTATPAAVPMS